MAKRKVKICKNQQCEHRVNGPDAPVCIGCGASFRGVSWKFLSEEEIEKALLPEIIEEESEEVQEEEAKVEENMDREVIICPNCGAHVTYYVGVQECPECGEYIQEELPVKESEILAEDKPVQEFVVKGMRTIDGNCFLDFNKEYMEIGRLALGKEYFEGYGKRKVSRQHAKVHKREDGWYISYCRPEDRNYYGGVQNPIYINNVELGINENYRLQVGDMVAFAELDMSDPMAAFFRVE